MSDYGTRLTDKAVRETETRLKSVYKQASREIKAKLADWEKTHSEREKQYRQMLADGKITQADFDAWMRGQVFQGNQWKARQQQIDQILLNADKVAAQIVNEGKLGVFAANANYMGYQLERNAGVNTGFNLYDGNTVGRLIRKDPNMLPKARKEVKKDKSYSWYNKQMASAVTQGIVQGEGVREIAHRIAERTGESSYKAALRNARTAYTGAQNAGRMEGLHQAQGLGINVKKQWVATNDDRTRDTHADLDGQIRDVDEPFEVDGMEIDYPGDPTADPSLVYNCRCTLVYVYPDYPSEMQRRDNETGEVVGDMTYREWEAMKNGQQPEAEPEAPARENTNIHGREISIDERLTGETRETLETLIDQYDTRLEKVELGQASGVMAAGSVDMSGASMKISQREPTVAIHEFAHSLANSSADKYGLTHDGDFWKEIRKIRREYKKDVDREYNFRRFISSYEHGQTGAESIDEFFAEAFAQAKAREMGLPLPDKYGEDFTYSQRVLDAVDKYFRRGKHGNR